MQTVSAGRGQASHLEGAVWAGRGAGGGRLGAGLRGERRTQSYVAVRVEFNLYQRQVGHLLAQFLGVGYSRTPCSWPGAMVPAQPERQDGVPVLRTVCGDHGCGTSLR